MAVILLEVIIKIKIYVKYRNYRIKNGFWFKIKGDKELYYYEMQNNSIKEANIGIMIKRYKRVEVWLVNENNWEEKVDEWAREKREEIKQKLLEDEQLGKYARV
jgi:hypothetical protein